jgi:hypothetical protein
MSDSRLPRWRHDVMNQIGIILGFAGLILDDMDPADPRRADVQEISAAASRAMELIEQLDGENNT